MLHDASREYATRSRVMGSFSMAHWLVVAVVVLVLFGRGKIADTMGDFGKGIKSFRQGLSDDYAPRSQLPAVNAEAGATLTDSDSKLHG
jgi:sec-independent protein translocase protein TatA